jgi:enoyl-CoA hydratase/carnithine racemase
MFALGIDNGVARLVLDRPEARNAVPADQWQRLGALAQEAARSGARLLILSGQGGAFCAGADLKDFPLLKGDEAARTGFRLAMHEGLDALAALPIPTIAAIDGPCFGAGVALAMACDIRIAGSGALFAITPAKFGISYPQEDVRRLVALVGSGQAARLLFGAAAIDGAEAERIGLVEIFARDAFSEAVEGMEAAILANSADSIAALKRGLRLAADGIALDEAQDRRFDDLFASDDFAARFAALRRPTGG